MTEPKMHTLPSWAPMAGTTFGTRNSIWVKATAGQGVIEHEKRHLFQLARDGAWRFRLRYAFSWGWRLRYEADAYAVSVKYGASPNQCAKWLSSWMYLWCATHDQALTAILEARAALAKEAP